MNKKILHIIRANAISGAENHVFMLLSALSKLGYEIRLMTLTDKFIGNTSDGYKKKLQQLEAEGIEIIELAVNGKFDWSAVPRLKAAIKKIKPDLVHTHMPYADMFGGIAAKMAGVPVVITSRHYDYSFSKSEINRFKAYYFLANKSHNAVIPISGRVEELCEKVEGWPKSKICKVLYGCEDQKVDKIQARNKILAELALPEDTVLIGTVARLIEWKGHRYAIDALEEINKIHGDKVKWLFIGDGPIGSQLQQMARDKEVDDVLIFMGHRTDIPELMASLDIMVHPTTGEGFGLIFLEAMTQATAIVSTNTGAIPEIIKDGETGFIVEPRNGAAIARSVNRLIEDKDLCRRFGENGRLRYENYFTVERMAKQISDVYAKFENAR